MSDRTDIPTTDEELVEMHKAAKKKRQRRRIITIVIVVAAVIIALAVVIVMLRNRVNNAMFGDAGSVEEAVVTVGSISTTVTGSGTLKNETEEDIDVPEALEVTEIYVEDGDTVAEGELLAAVTSSSLMGAMSDTQEAIDDLDEQLTEAAGETVNSTITSSVSGRVKYIGVTEGESVATAMYHDGCLMLLSLDGYMAVDINTDDLRANESVTVKTSDGTAYDGRVESAAGGSATVLITDDGPLYQDTVTVETKSGTVAGSGTLYPHNEMAITGYAGTVSSIDVAENSLVSEGTTLLTLTDTETSASYDTLLVEREAYEDQLDSLIRIYRDGGICAPFAGTIASVDEDVVEDEESSSSSSGRSLWSQYLRSFSSDSDTIDTDEVTVASIAPDDNMVVEIDVDEMDILSLSVGQAAFVVIESIDEDTAYEGTVTDISTEASTSSGVTSYEVQVTIPKASEMLDGMSASVAIRIEGVEDALIIPVEALHQTSDTAYVYTEYNESDNEFSGAVSVTAGLSNDTYVEILSGLSEGDVVYYTPSEEDRFGPSSGGGDADEDREEMPDEAPDGGGGGGEPGGQGPGGR